MVRKILMVLVAGVALVAGPTAQAGHGGGFGGGHFGGGGFGGAHFGGGGFGGAHFGGGFGGAHFGGVGGGHFGGGFGVSHLGGRPFGRAFDGEFGRRFDRDRRFARGLGYHGYYDYGCSYGYPYYSYYYNSDSCYLPWY
jgi:hypothetical protein